MTISSIEVVVYTAYFVLPGYVIYGIINSFVPMQIRSDAEKVLRFILYNLLNLVLLCRNCKYRCQFNYER